MSRYDWPPAPRVGRDQPGRRQAWNLTRDAGADAEQIDAAREMRRLHEVAAATAPPEAEADTAAAAVERLAPTGPANLWLPIGPTTTLRGTGDSDPRVAGRVRDLQISPDGQRIYAATAIGGLWYSQNAGASWEPVGAFAATLDRTAITPASNTLACGAVHVRWAPAGSANPPADDEVWLGTGEPNPRQQPTDYGVLGYYGGVGILHATGPVAAVRANPNADPWTRQAQPRPGPPAYQGLRGAGIFAITADPDDPRRLVAATTRGLHVHDPAAAPGTDPWSLVTDPTWNIRPGSPGSGRLVVTDVVWLPGDAGAGQPSRLWVAIRQTGTALTGLWRSDNGVAGPFNEVVLPGARNAAGNPRVQRLGLAAAPVNRDVLYVLGSGPRMWRIDGAATVRRVTRLPTQLFGAGGDASHYALSIAVDPTQPPTAADPNQPRRFLIAGLSATSSVDGSPAAAMYRLTVPAAAPAAGAAWATDYVGGNQFDARWVGGEVHPDVHRLRWVVVGGVGQVFAATDGGVFHSTATPDPPAPTAQEAGGLGTFVSRASSMAVSEAGFIASNPDTDGPVLIGTQDNGAQLRLGGVWRRVLRVGDAGGVAFDPGQPGRVITQYTNSDWQVFDDEFVGPTWRTGNNAARQTEHNASRFYSNPAVRRRADGVTQLAIGTTRIWYSERWGHSRWDAAAGVWRRDWVSLPSNTDPRAGDAPNTALNNLPPGPFPAGTVDNSRGIRVLRWGSDHRLYALLPGAVYRLDRIPATGAWTRTRIHQRPAMPLIFARPPPVAGANLPPDGTLNDLAVHDVTAGPNGSFYLGTSHPTEPVWWFDGANPGTWHPCGLGVLPPPAPAPPDAPDGVRAPVYSIVVDPDHPEIVYAGTAVGVWRGVLTPAAGGNPPSWRWTIFSNGLPEAAVQDLTIERWPLPQGGTLRLMRAALQARGAWEVDLDAPADPVTYVRAHSYDTRRMRPVPMADPLFLPARRERDWTLDWALRRNRDHRTPAGLPANHPDGTPPGELLWHASPDIRVRPAPGVPLPAPTTTLPWTNVPADRFQLWALQTALHALDPRVVPDGRWTAWFRRRLRMIRTDPARGLSNQARVDAALWNHGTVQAGFWADPWAPGGPTEADLTERIVGMATPRPGPNVNARATSAASVALPASPARVDVCIHRRGLTEAAAGTVAVLLLRMPLPTGAAPAAGPHGWAATAALAFANQAALETAMQNAPPTGGPLPVAVAVPAPWQVADTAVALRRPTRPIRTADAAVVTFEVDFSGQAGTTWLLFALVHHGAGTPALGGAADLRDQVRRSPHVAARSVQIV
jgi:hypothetical protein